MKKSSSQLNAPVSTTEPPLGIIYTKVVILGKGKSILEGTMSLFSMG